MTFTARPGIILHESNLPGNFATMFAPDGNKLLPRSDASTANDLTRRYVWAFVWDKPLVDGQVFVFATADREVAAVVVEGKLASGGPVAVKRYKDGNPWELDRAAKPRSLSAASAAIPALEAPAGDALRGRQSVPAGMGALVDVTGAGSIEVCSASGKTLYIIQAPTERALLSMHAAEVVGGDGVEFRFGPL